MNPFSPNPSLPPSEPRESDTRPGPSRAPSVWVPGYAEMRGWYAVFVGRAAVEYAGIGMTTELGRAYQFSTKAECAAWCEAQTEKVWEPVEVDVPQARYL